MAALRIPSIVVLHTVLPAPTDSQREVLERVCELASAVVVMTAAANDILAAGYVVPHYKVSVIPHGVATWTTDARPRGHQAKRTR